MSHKMTDQVSHMYVSVTHLTIHCVCVCVRACVRVCVCVHAQTFTTVWVVIETVLTVPHALSSAGVIVKTLSSLPKATINIFIHSTTFLLLGSSLGSSNVVIDPILT